MTDLEITKLCAEAMGYENPRVTKTFNGDEFITYGPLDSAVLPQYWPLQYDPQCFAMVKKLRLDIEPCFSGDDGAWMVSTWLPDNNGRTNKHTNSNLNRAICECVAKMQQAKSGR